MKLKEQYIKFKWGLDKELAQYIADYINEELERDNSINGNTIKDAVDAFDGGAR
jgi:hypothetical protein